MREPVARVVSDRNHHVAHRGITQPPVAFAAEPKRRNLTARTLGPGWRRFGFVGITERYAACLPGLAAHLGADRIAEERANRGLRPDGMPGGRIGAEAAAAIAALNAEDAALYAAVLARRDAAGGWAADPPEHAPRLRARPAPGGGGGAWRGWCADADGLRTWTVAVRHAGRGVARLRVDRFAPRLAARRGVRTGIGRFAFDAAAAGLPPGARPTFAAVDAPGTPVTDAVG